MPSSPWEVNQSNGPQCQHTVNNMVLSLWEGFGRFVSGLTNNCILKTAITCIGRNTYVLMCIFCIVSCINLVYIGVNRQCSGTANPCGNNVIRNVACRMLGQYICNDYIRFIITLSLLKDTTSQTVLACIPCHEFGGRYWIGRPLHLLSDGPHVMLNICCG